MCTLAETATSVKSMVPGAAVVGAVGVETVDMSAAVSVDGAAVVPLVSGEELAVVPAVSDCVVVAALFAHDVTKQINSINATGRTVFFIISSIIIKHVLVVDIKRKRKILNVLILT